MGVVLKRWISSGGDVMQGGQLLAEKGPKTACRGIPGDPFQNQHLPLIHDGAGNSEWDAEDTGGAE